MNKSREEVLADVLQLLQTMNESWEYEKPIGEDTYLLTDLALQSMDVAILGSTIHHEYGRVLPFADFLKETAQSNRQDVTVGEVVDFIYKHLNIAPVEDPAEGVQA